MITYEYVWKHDLTSEDDNAEEQLTNASKALVEEGWRIVAVYCHGSGHPVLLMERPAKKKARKP